jgi:hypothetical protein
MTLCPRRSLVARPLLAVLLLAFAVQAPALDLLSPLKSLFGPDETVLWKGPGQFVKIVEQDRIRKDRRPTKNSHPAQLTAAQLGTVLASLKVEEAGKPVPIFTQTEITLLAEHMENGFDRAQPTQDVVFAVAGGQENVAGQRLTAGRMFMQGQRLQIIFGDVHGPGGGDPDNISHFAEPHRAGKRKEPVDKDLVIAAGPGITHSTVSDRPRTDWILIDVPTVIAAWRGPPVLPAAAATPIPAPGTPLAAPSATAPAATAPPISAEQQKLLQERREMLEEMARLRKQVQQQNAAGGAAPAQSPPPATGKTPAKAGQSIEERLSTLQELHAKKLITDEEYEAKRKELLEEL